eukprot:17047_1
MIISLIAFSALFSLLHAYTGCGSSASAEKFVLPKLYACNGLFSVGGVYGDQAEALCGLNYHVCKSAHEVEALGLTKAICKGIAANNQEFFATQETSSGNLRCYSHNNGDPAMIGQQNGYNDIWGCAQDGSPYLYGGGGTYDDCGQLTAFVGQGTKGGWVFTGASTMEAVTTKLILTTPSSGGVLCCEDDAVVESASCVYAGIALSPSHDCTCQANCDGNYCNSIEKVAEHTGDNPDYVCDSGTTCCCHCANCDSQ